MSIFVVKMVCLSVDLECFVSHLWGCLRVFSWGIQVPFSGLIGCCFWDLLFMFSSFLISIYLGFYMNFWQCSSIFELFIYQVWRVTSEILGVFTGRDLLGTLSCGVPELCPWTKFRDTFSKTNVSLDFRDMIRDTTRIFVYLIVSLSSTK